MESLKRFVAGLTSAVVAFVAVFSAFPASSVSLADSTTSSWATQYVEFLQTSTFVNTGPFNGRNTISRAELAKMMYETGVAAGEVTAVDINDLDETLYTDVPKFLANGNPNWQFKYVVGLRSQGLLSSAHSTFRPNDPINRAEAAQLIANVFGYDGAYTGTSMFDDVSTSDWYFDAVNNLADLGVVSGKGYRNFAPGDSILREEAAKIVTCSFLYNTDQVTCDEYFGEPEPTPEPGPEPGPTPPVPQAGSLEVRLSSNTPASTTVPKNAISIPVATYDFTASFDSSIQISQLVASLTGLVSNNDIDKVWVTDEQGVKLGNERSMTSNNVANLTFGQSPIVVGAGQTRSLTLNLSLKSCTSECSGKTFALGLASKDAVMSSAERVIIAGSNYGNIMTTSSFSVTEVLFDPQPNATLVATVEAGSTQKEIAKFKLQNGGDNNRAIVLKQATLKLRAPTNTSGGSVTNANSSKPTLNEVVETSTLTLEALGSNVLKSAQVNGDYLTLMFKDGYTLGDGDSRIFTLRADILASDLNEAIQFEVKDQSDFVMYEEGTMFGAPLVHTLNSSSDAAAEGSTTYTGIYNIRVGRVTLSKKAPGHITDQEYAADTSDIKLVEGKLTVDTPVRFEGFQVRVDTLNAPVDSSSCSATKCSAYSTLSSAVTAGVADDIVEDVFENVKLYLNGQLIDTASDDTVVTGSTVAFDFDTTFEVNTTSEILITADVKDSITGDSASRNYAGSFFKFKLDNSDLEDAEFVLTGDTISSSDKTGTATGNKVEITASTLTVTVNDGLSGKTIIAGATDATLMQFNLKANSSGAVRVTGITLTGTGADVSAAYTTTSSEMALVDNLTVYIDGQQMGASQSLDSATFTDLDFTIPSGSSRTVLVKGTLDGSLGDDAAATGFLQLRLDSLTAYNTAEQVISVDGVDGSALTVSDSGQLTVSRVDEEAVKSNILLGGVNDQDVFAIRFRAVNDDVFVTDIHVQALDAGSTTSTTSTAIDDDDTSPTQSAVTNRVATLSLYSESNELLSSLPFTSSSTTTKVHFELSDDSSIFVPRGTTTTVYVRADFNTITREEDTGLRLVLGLDTSAGITDTGITATSASTSNTLTSAKINNDAVLSGIVSNQFIVTKSKPVVDILPAGSQQDNIILFTGSSREFMKFTVTADDAGDITLAQMAFEFKPSSNITVSAGTGYIYEVVGGSVDEDPNDSVGAKYLTAVTSATDSADARFKFKLNNPADDEDPDTGSIYERVSAGTTKTYALFIPISESGDGNLGVTILGDSTFVAADEPTDLFSGNNFIWSDESDDEGDSSSVSSETTDFFNGTQVRKLPATFTRTKG